MQIKPDVTNQHQRCASFAMQYAVLLFYEILTVVFGLSVVL